MEDMKAVTVWADVNNLLTNIGISPDLTDCCICGKPVATVGTFSTYDGELEVSLFCHGKVDTHTFISTGPGVMKRLTNGR